jgi:hypothetical protein
MAARLRLQVTDLTIGCLWRRSTKLCSERGDWDFYDVPALLKSATRGIELRRSAAVLPLGGREPAADILSEDPGGNTWGRRF